MTSWSPEFIDSPVNANVGEFAVDANVTDGFVHGPVIVNTGRVSTFPEFVTFNAPATLPAPNVKGKVNGNVNPDPVPGGDTLADTVGAE